MHALQIDRCDQLTHYLTKIQGPASTSTAASDGPSTEVASFDGYKVRSLLPCTSLQQEHRHLLCSCCRQGPSFLG